MLQRYLDAIYLPFWRHEFDAEDPKLCSKLWIKSAHRAAGFKAFAEGAGKTTTMPCSSRHLTGESMACLTCCPSILMRRINASQFLGKEHLPRIAWMLAGQQGDAPDVATNSHLT